MVGSVWRCGRRSSTATAWCARRVHRQPRGDQWPGSRVISAQKANTANAFSLPPSRCPPRTSTARCSRAAACSGCRHSNPVDVDVAYGGNPTNNGQANDPMVGGRIGGVNVFGGGLALYNAERRLIGGIGVSGDSSCADHNIAWRTRQTLGLDNVPAGVSGDASRPDNIVYDITPQPGQMPGVSAGWLGTSGMQPGSDSDRRNARHRPITDADCW